MIEVAKACGALTVSCHKSNIEPLKEAPPYMPDSRRNASTLSRSEPRAS